MQPAKSSEQIQTHLEKKLQPRKCLKMHFSNTSQVCLGVGDLLKRLEEYSNKKYSKK